MVGGGRVLLVQVVGGGGVFAFLCVSVGFGLGYFLGLVGPVWVVVIGVGGCGGGLLPRVVAVLRPCGCSC